MDRQLGGGGRTGDDDSAVWAGEGAPVSAIGADGRHAGDVCGEAGKTGKLAILFLELRLV